MESMTSDRTSELFLAMKVCDFSYDEMSHVGACIKIIQEAINKGNEGLEKCHGATKEQFLKLLKEADSELKP